MIPGQQLHYVYAVSLSLSPIQSLLIVHSSWYYPPSGIMSERGGHQPGGSDFHQDLLSPSWPALILFYNCWKGGALPPPCPPSLEEAWGGQPVSVSSLCVHPATLRLTLSVGNHKRVSGTERGLLCEAPPPPALCQPFLNHSVRQ